MTALNSIHLLARRIQTVGVSSAAAAPGRAVHPAQHRQVPHHRAVAVVAPLHQSQAAPQRPQDRGGVAAERGGNPFNIVYIRSECYHHSSFQLEVEQLKARCEKLEKERNAFKFNSDQLEAKVWFSLNFLPGFIRVQTTVTFRPCSRSQRCRSTWQTSRRPPTKRLKSWKRSRPNDGGWRRK